MSSTIDHTITAAITICGEESLRAVITPQFDGNREVGTYDVVISDRGGEITRFRVENWLRGAGADALATFCLDAVINVANAKKIACQEDSIYGGKPPAFIDVVDAIREARIVSTVKRPDVPVALVHVQK